MAAGDVVIYQESGGSWLRRTIAAGAKLLKLSNPIEAMEIQCFTGAVSEAVLNSDSPKNLTVGTLTGEVGSATWNNTSKRVIPGVAGKYLVRFDFEFTVGMAGVTEVIVGFHGVGSHALTITDSSGNQLGQNYRQSGSLVEVITISDITTGIGVSAETTTDDGTDSVTVIGKLSIQRIS